MKIETLYSYDFDGTLVHSPTPTEGMDVWVRETGTEWPHNGWWGKSETLDPSIFYIPRNEWVYKKYIESIKEENSYNILATGRLEKVNNMRNNIDMILKQHDMNFDEIHLNNMGDTYRFKKRLFDNLIEKTKCKHFVMLDDRYDHLTKFYEWAQTKDIKITIVDVLNKTTKIYNDI